MRFFLILLLLAFPAAAQFPEPARPISLIVPYPPGGGNDISARALQPLLERELGVPVVVVNRPGASSQIGLAQTARARPDGTTLCYGLWPSTITLYLDSTRPAGFGRDSFTPLALHVVDPGTIIVRADSPLRDLAGLIALARARPDDVRVSDNGQLGWEHLAVLRLQGMFGVRFNGIHYQGSAPALLALLAGETEVALVAAGTAMTQSRAGVTRTLAVLDAAPSPFLPGIPTATAEGVPLVMGSARGFVGPAGMPAAVTARLAAGLAAAIAAPEHAARMRDLGLPIRFMDPGAFTAFWSEQEALLRPLVLDAVRADR
jgi:tripartite-type tricarboxylate transporter receptor subunit TctC